MDLQNSINLIMELEKLKAVYRKAKVRSDNNRYENSAEHCWHASLAAQILVYFSDIKVDINKVVRMLLVHDISEIYVGDIFAFADVKSYEQHTQSEYAAMNALFNHFPVENAVVFRDLWVEFEQGETPETQFALCMDRIMPFLQNIHNEGGSWTDFNISKSQILKRNVMLKQVSTQLWNYINSELDKAVAKGWILDN